MVILKVSQRIVRNGMRFISSAKGDIIGNPVNKLCPDYLKNREGMELLVKELKEKTVKITRGGGENAIKRHTSKGKLLVRERINALLDPGTPFLELSQLAAYEMYGADEVPSAGIITGIGSNVW